MKELKLSDQLSDGMLLQWGMKIRIWGYDEPGRNVMVCFLGEEYVGRTGQDGVWEVWLLKVSKGGPATMYIRDEQGNEEVIADIRIV